MDQDNGQKIKRTPASENFWYCLATYHGVRDFNFSLSPYNKSKVSKKNKDTWNSFMLYLLQDKAGEFLKNELVKQIKQISHIEYRNIITNIEREIGEINIDNIIGRIEFSDITINEKLSFDGYFFPYKLFIDKCKINYIGITDSFLAGGCELKNCNFIGDFAISSAIINNNIDINNCKFMNKVNFNSLNNNIFRINKSSFSKQLNFVSITNNRFIFTENSVKDKVNFESCFFKISEFINSEFLNVTTFNNIIFKDPPLFHGASLHEGTILEKIKWPQKPLELDSLSGSCAAYERLKLEMDRLKKHEDEMFFFAKELECRRVMLGPVKGLPIALYGLFSDYGRSYFRPFAGLLATAFLPAFCWWDKFGEANLIKAIGVSLANTLALFNFRKDFVAAADLQDLSPFLTTIAAGQTLFGILFMFLLGLALRNHMRMK